MLTDAARLIGFLCVLLSVGHASTAEAQQPGQVFPYRWAGPVPYEQVTTADLQHALIWTRHYDGLTDGEYGPGTKNAVRAWLLAKGAPPTDRLTRPQTLDLVAEGLRERDAVGWALLKDDAVGFAIGIPGKLTESARPEVKDGRLQYAARGRVSHFVDVFPTKAGCADFEALYQQYSRPIDGQRVVLSRARGDDWFVVTGEAGARRFYRRTQCRDQGVLTAVMNVAKDQVDALGFLFIALSNSFQVRPTLNPRAQPAPHLQVPASPPGQAAAVAPPPATTTGQAGSAFAGDRSGKTDAIRLALADGAELRPREIFERVSRAVYVVRTKDSQGSAVAIGERTLLTNCHVMRTSTAATLEQDGRKSAARLISANAGDDRCVLQSDTPLGRWVKVRPFADVKVGEPAFTIGAPQGFELTIAEGIVSSKRTMDGDRLIQTSAPISKGSSGGGLFDAHGNLIGITTWMRKDAQNLNFAIAAEEYAR